MNDPVIVASRNFLARTEPGKGDEHPDDGVSGDVKVRIRSIPHVTTARLLRRRDVLCHTVFTVEGLHAFDDPRRALIHLGVHIQCINHELQLRGTQP